MAAVEAAAAALRSGIDLRLWQNCNIMALKRRDAFKMIAVSDSSPSVKHLFESDPKTLDSLGLLTRSIGPTQKSIFVKRVYQFHVAPRN
jgi:hypothetical protein